MSFIRTLDRLLVKSETAILVLFLSVMILLSFAQVFLRNVWGIGFLWADPLIRHLVIWVGFLGAAVATHEDRHISIDAITRFLPPRIKSLAHILTSVFALVVCYFLADAAWKFFIDEKISGEELVLSIPLWAAIVIIPVGYGLMMIHFLVKIAEHAVLLFARPEARPQ
ncbi:MAG: TRAP transporter small permease [Ignavibacteriae bacterium]|nr:TRAP transporter small permease [Ignavibacteriota bacterium]